MAEASSTQSDQESKKDPRSTLIEHAVKCLTTERSTSVCVKRDHVARVWKQLREYGKADTFTGGERVEIEEEIGQWEIFHDSQVQKRKPSDLRVCYLGGDNPMNDLKVFEENGVLCQNIWVIKKDSEELEKAWNAIKKLQLRNVRLFKGDIVTFLKDFRGQFDIIYFDACGTLPSVKQNTLKVIGYVFLYDKLTSPGALISNFSFPPQERNYLSSQEVDKERDMINFLVKEYMKYRLCNVLGKANSPTINAEYLSARTDEDNYGDYLTFQVIDSAYLFIPAQRMLLSKGESLWGQMFNFSSNVESTHEKSTKTRRNQELMESLKVLKEMYNSSFFYQRKVESNPCCEAWVAEIFPDWESEPSEKKHSSHLSSVQHSPPFNVIQFCETVSKCLVPLLKADFDERVLRCCDVTPKQAACLVADLLYGQMAYPSFPVMDKLLRLNYTSKMGQMFSDVFVFDKCRYLYEQFPSVDCVSFAEPKQQMVFRMVVDGLRKHLGGICSEDLFKFGNVASTNAITLGGVSFPNSERSIPKRQKKEDTLLKVKQSEATIESPWVVTSAERLHYDAIFKQADKDGDGLVSGREVLRRFIASGQSPHIAAYIWDFINIKSWGQLNSKRFANAMDLMERMSMFVMLPSLKTHRVVLPSMKTHRVVLPSMKTSSDGMPVAAGKAMASTESTWVVTNAETLFYDAIFEGVDKDGDGLVSGWEVLRRFIDSGQPPHIIEHIWDFWDIESREQLNSKQFALTMRLMNKAVMGVDPLLTCNPYMMLPSMKTSSAGMPVAAGKAMVPSLKQSHSPTTTELHNLSGEIKDLARDRAKLRHEIEETKDALRTIRKMQVPSLKQSHSPTTTELHNLSGEIKDLARDRAKLRHEIEETKDALRTIGKMQDLESEIVKMKCQELEKQKTEAQRKLELEKEQKGEELSQVLKEFWKLQQEEAKLERLLDSKLDDVFSSFPFKMPGWRSDSNKKSSDKDSSSSVKDPISNPFGCVSGEI